MNPADVMGLRRLMARTEGSRDITVSVIDGPIWLDHPAFSGQRVRQIGRNIPAACHFRGSPACRHGTLVMGMLAAKRNSDAPGLCPGCTFIVRAIFPENTPGEDPMPVSTPTDLAAAISDSISAGANVINLSAALTQLSSQSDQLEQALDNAAHHGVLVVAAAGNHGTVGSSAVTSHPWVIPVVACDPHGRLTPESNLGASIGRHGLAAPGENITSIGSDGKPGTFSGTSAAAPFVTGAIALLWSEFPKAAVGRIKLAVTGADGRPRKSIVPPTLNAGAAYSRMANN